MEEKKRSEFFSKLYRKFYNLYERFSEDTGIDILPLSLKVYLRSFVAKILSRKGKKYPYPDKSVLDFDWDSLIIIDASRYDLFCEKYPESDYIISKGSHTDEWFKNTFDEKYHDLIYISGNPVVSKPGQESLKKNKCSFYKLVPVWDKGWDKELKTAPPEKVTEKAVEMHKKFPGEKMIIHYLQPHQPFIGEKKVIGTGMDYTLHERKGEKLKDKSTPWDLLRAGEIDKKEIWKAYRKNLDLVMKEVNKLKRKLKGKVVLTSDHGNCKGEYGIYGHPRFLRIEELVKVPWKVLKDGGRLESEASNLEV